MKSYIDDLIVTDPNGEKSILYTRTKQEAVEGLQDRLTNIEIPDITTTDSTTLPNSHSGRVLIEHIGGNMEQKSTEGNQLWNGKYVTVALTDERDIFTEGTTMAGNLYMPVTVGEQYTFSINGTPTQIRYMFIDIDKNEITSLTNASTTAVAPENAVYMTWRTVDYHKETDECMLNTGTTALPYEEYSGGKPSPSPSYQQEIKGVKGKNELDCRGLTEKTVNGVKFTPVYDEFGNLLYAEANGTATSDADYVCGSFTLLPKEEYIFSGCPNGGSATTYRMGFTNVGNEYGSGIKYSSENELLTYPFIRIQAGYTADHIRFYPMIRSASVVDDTYVPYGLIRIKGHGKNFCPTYEQNVNTNIFLSDKIYVKENNTYTLSYIKERIAGATIGNQTLHQCSYSEYDSRGNRLGTITNSVIVLPSGSATCKHTINTRKGTSYIVVNFSNNNGDVSTNTKVYNVQLEEGTETTPYEPYTEQSIILSQPMELYGKNDVQDLLTPREIENECKVITLKGNEGWRLNNAGTQYYIVLKDATVNMGGIVFATHFSCGEWISAKDANIISLGNDDAGVLGITATSFDSVDDLISFLQSNEVKVVYELAEPSTETLPIADQIALNSLQSFDGITYVEFDTEVQPTWKAKYGTSEVGGYTLESLLTARNNELKQNLALERITALEATLVNNI